VLPVNPIPVPAPPPINPYVYQPIGFPPPPKPYVYVAPSYSPSNNPSPNYGGYHDPYYKKF
jgi:hypothetical protein